MKVNDKDIIIEIGASTSKTAKDFKNLTSEMKNLSKAIPTLALENLKQIFGNGKFIDTKNLKEQADSAEKSINRTKKSLSSFRDAFRNKAKEVSLFDPVKFEKQLNSIDAAIERAQKKIETYQRSLAAEKSAEGGGDETNIKAINAAIEEQGSLIGELINRRKALTESGSEESQERFANALNKVRDAARKAGSSVLRFSKNIALAPFKSAGEKVSAFAKKINGLGASLKRVAFYRAIRTAIKEIGDAFRVGTENLYFYSQGIGGEFAKSMDMAATSMLYFKNSIGAAVAPIVNALTPVLDMLVDKIVDVINVVNQLISKLTGATYWTKAIKHPVEYKEAVEETGKAAKEALRYLAPFDELNILPSEKIGKGRAASAAEDYSAMFEEVTEYNKNISDFAKNLKAAIKRSDWAGVGRLLGEKVNSVINKIDFAGIGKKVGSGINSWFTAKYWTLKTINFTNIGKKISSFLNNAIASINFETIGRSIIRVFTAGLDFAIGFLTELDFGQLGETISDFFIGALNEATEWLKSKDWSQIGKKLGNAVAEFFGRIDWDGLADSFFEFLGTAISSVTDFAVSFVFGISKIEPKDGLNKSEIIKLIGSGLGAVTGGIIGAATGGIPGALLGASIGLGVSLILSGISTTASGENKGAIGNIAKAIGAFVGGKIGFKVGGPAGALIGAAIGFGITGTLAGVTFLSGASGSDKQKAIKEIVAGLAPIVGTAIGFFVGGPAGAAIGATVGVGVSLLITSVNWTQMLSDLKSDFETAWDNFVDWLSGIGWLNDLVQKLGGNIEDLRINPKVELAPENYVIPDAFVDKFNRENEERLGLTKGTLDIPVQMRGEKLNYQIEQSLKEHGAFSVKSKVVSMSVADTLPLGKRTINAIASFVETKKDKLSKAARTIDVIAQYKKAFASSLSKAAKTINTIARFGKTDKSNLTAEQKTIASTANLSKVKVSVKRPVINITGNIDKIITKGGGVIEIKKDGGVFSNGKWKPINAYAGGGSPLSGEVFLAREAGPELVGRMGSNTAVMNNNQIVASVSDGVAVANEAVVGALFSAAAQIVSAIREQDRGGGGSAGIDTIARAVTRWQRNASIANGV